MLALASFFLPLFAFSQIELKGTVIDSVTRQPLAFVTVSSSDGVARDIADEKGRYSLMVSQVPIALQFHLIGYDDREVIIAGKAKRTIALHESAYELSAIEITGAQQSVIAGNKRRSIWDYAWSDDRLLICEYGTSLSKARIIMMSTTGDTLATVVCPERPQELFNDCMGNAHMQGKDSTYQLVCDEEAIYFMRGVANYDVDHLLRNCTGADPSNLYFAIPPQGYFFQDLSATGFKFNTNNHELYYFFGKRTGTGLSFLTHVADKEAAKLITEEQGYGIGAGNKKFPENSYSRNAGKVFFYRILLKEIYAPLFALRDSVYLLDHVNQTLAVFDQEGDLHRTAQLQYCGEPSFSHNCIADNEHQKVYACFVANGLTVVREIDLNRGEVKKGTTIPIPFPEKITVKDGYAYFLHRDPMEKEARILSRIQLER